MSKLLYGLVLLVLFLLSLAFLSYFLVTLDGFDWAQPIVDNATKYLPMLLIPVLVAMGVVLLLRWIARDKEERVGAGDFIAALLAFALQFGVMLFWRAQGNDVEGSWNWSVPEVEQISQHADTIGVLGVAALQFLAFFFFWRAKPDAEVDHDD